ncbi:DEAD/DEAH box helicase [Ligilactobacillus salivarius]|uniref:DEAD/DEAH box helicase n=1 Tax=Ligilactobacillus salivarius TaxID=1624 RepID=UPI00189805D0|nr:DEAD/DEAH box helicase [Ligilactobacillus salivarius]MDE1507465.1 DEAD/DEAH box helicase [Ligilactobacillus salivarius]MDE1522204.1 DEAD/DEAH box helicase [Ligilactobacillus salivarius]
MNPKFEEQFRQEGFTEPTLIQKHVYPKLAEGKNVVGLAPTGSGKTLAYSLPLLEKILPKDGSQLLIMAPSQELAAQLTNTIRPWAKLLDLSVIGLLGGANVKRQIEKLKKHPEVVIGTPGRLLNLINLKKLKLHKIESIVIDEADEMLGDEDSLNDVREIVSHCPSEAQISFFSATEAPILSELHRWFGVDVERIDVRKEDNTRGEVTNYMIETPTRKRTEMLRRLGHVDDFYALVFFKQTATLRDVAEKLLHMKVPVAILSSEQRQVDRQKSLRQLRKREIRFVLTTDVAARGLDLPDLPAVVNYDLPKDTNTYIHRAGRTGRMGADGIVVNLGNEHDLRLFKQLMSGTDFVIEKGILYAGKLIPESEKALIVVEDERPNKKATKKKIKDKKPTRKEEKATEKKKKKRKRNLKNKGKRHGRKKDK